MKTKKAGKKMTLNKKTVANLETTNMNEVKGGFVWSVTRTSGGIPGCYCDSKYFCTCPKACPC
jgi:hypothetical protein